MVSVGNDVQNPGKIGGDRFNKGSQDLFHGIVFRSHREPYDRNVLDIVKNGVMAEIRPIKQVAHFFAAAVKQIMPVLKIYPQGDGQVEIVLHPTNKRPQFIFCLFRDPGIKADVKASVDIGRDAYFSLSGLYPDIAVFHAFILLSVCL